MPSPSSAPTLDAAAIDQLRQFDPDGSAGVVERVLTAYRNSVVRQFDRLQAQAPAPDAAAVADIAHHLKASSASVGATTLAAACADIDRRIRSGLPGDLHADVARLTVELQSARQAVEAMLPT